MTDKRKHILILPKWYPNPSDLQLGVFVKNQASLIAEKYQSTVLYVQSIPMSSDSYTIKSVDVEGVNEIRVYFRESRFLKKINHFFKYRKAQKLGLSTIKSNIDLVHIHVPIRPSFLAKLLHKSRKTPYIVTEHWSGHLNGQFDQKSLLYKTIYKNVLQKSSAITAVSSPLAEKLSSIVKKPIEIIPNYISSSVKSVSKLSDQRIEIVSVSDLNNSTKNITGLLEGFNLALQENERMHLSIIGDGPDKKLVIDTVLKLGIADKVTLLGRKSQTEVLELLPIYHFYICYSNVETFGMTVAEAILSGLPVVCTRCGGPETFVNESNGLLCEPNNTVEIVALILKMAETYKTYNATALKREIDNQFGAEVVLNQWDRLYRSILNG